MEPTAARNPLITIHNHMEANSPMMMMLSVPFGAINLLHWSAFSKYHSNNFLCKCAALNDDAIVIQRRDFVSPDSLHGQGRRGSGSNELCAHGIANL
jgi:hypothetical protein